MTAHEHHTHPETAEPYCCCGWGYPDPIRSGQPTDGLPNRATLSDGRATVARSAMTDAAQLALWRTLQEGIA